MHLIWVLIVGAIIGALAGAVTKTSLGWILNIVAGLAGSYFGEMFLGNWGPHLAGMAIFPSIIGAVVLVIIASLIVNTLKRN